MSKELSELLSLFKKQKYSIAEKKCLNLIKKIKPNYEIFNIYAVILFELNKYDEAIKYWKKATELNPQYHFGYNNLGNVFLKKKNFKEALDYYDKAIKIKPDYYEAHYNKGHVLTEIKDFENAVKIFDKVIEMKSDYIPALKARNKFYIKENKLSKALNLLEKLIIYEPDNAGLYVQKAEVLLEMTKYEEAIKYYELAYKMDSTNQILIGNIIDVKTRICDWENFNYQIKRLEENILNKKKTIQPFTATTLFDSPKLLFEASNIYQSNFKQDKNIFSDNYHVGKKKIKLGFYSADFRTHAMGELMVQMLESHNKSLFELHGFYFGPPLNEKDLLQKRIIKCFDSFHKINELNDEDVLNLSKKIEIDIAIDCMCHTGKSRFQLFVKKIAPIQINFLGYPGTSGSKFVDYIVADKVIIPEQNQKYFTEKIIYLPDTYQANEDKKKISEKNFTRKDFGLPNDKFVFCSFNQNRKMNPKIFGLWMNILLKAKDSVLWIMKDSEISKNNLKNFAVKSGIDVNRLIFTHIVPLGEHLKRLQLADLVLDTFPYNAHTTCSDALRVNLPILTLKGESFASRVAASLLNSINMNELVTESAEDYEKLALKIFSDNDYFENIKSKIKENKKLSNLFNSAVYTKNIEKAYTIVYQNFIKGESPKNIEL